jgi:hypothetical protein
MNPREPLRIYGIACALTRRPVSVTPDFATAECLWTELNLFCRLGVRRERKATAARSCRVIHWDLDLGRLALGGRSSQVMLCA